MGLQFNQGAQSVQDNRNQQPAYDPYAQQSRVDVYIYGPDEGARVSNGQSIYFDCEVIAPYNQQAQPRWSRAGNQVTTAYACRSVCMQLSNTLF
jgi:hypothetical protein